MGGVVFGWVWVGEGVNFVYEFFGEYQVGIIILVQDYLYFVSFDMMFCMDCDDLIFFLQDWLYVVVWMMQGFEVSVSGVVNGFVEVFFDDMGEVLGFFVVGLIFIIGFGFGFFENEDGDCYGIVFRCLVGFECFLVFLGDDFDLQVLYGDFCIQVCVDDFQVVVYVICNFSCIVFGCVWLWWFQFGFGKILCMMVMQVIFRNFFGFKDGMVNILVDDVVVFVDYVWVVVDDEFVWMMGGFYFVVWKIVMLIEIWDCVWLLEQDMIIGRDKGEGVLFFGGDEFIVLDFYGLEIDVNSYVCFVYLEQNGGVWIFCCGYNYVDGNNVFGCFDVGLFFLFYQCDFVQFIVLQ